jgi:HSP20 family molecular chaperone IbpA
MTLLKTHTDPFDVLFKNFFNNDSFFAPALETKSSHPVDIYETKEGLHFEIACTGLSKEDVNINIEGDILRVIYEKDGENEIDITNYIHKGIARRSFNLGYKISSRFDLQNGDAQMDNGLLLISIPFAEQAKPKVLAIK